MTANHNIKPGIVYLVGGGPGDPGLLTCKAKELLVSCDVVCYDELISTAILSLVPSHVELLPTGYRGYRGSHISYDMHPLVIEQALLGKSVVRLKAGDPFIFGRATEECSALQANGIEYEVVPGITAALGAAAYAGFPLTSAGVASDVTFVSGHQSSKTIASWGSLGSSTGSLVLYMGSKKIIKHAQNLIDNGRDPKTPVAHISSATTSRQIVTKGTLETIGDKILSMNCKAPALVIMGDVVSLSEKLEWRDKLPHAGKHILIISGNSAENNLIKSLQKMGAEVVCPQLLTTEYFISDDDWQLVMQAKAIAFNDANSVESWNRQLHNRKLDLRAITWQLFSVSDDASKSLEALGLFNYQQVTVDSLSKKCLMLGADEKPDMSVWANKITPLRFKILKPDLAIVTDLKALEIILEQQPELLNGVKCVCNNNIDATKLLGKAKANYIEFYENLIF